MSNLTNILDKIRATLPTLTGFSAKTEIPNPYNLEDENINFLREGWGIRVGDSSPQTDTSHPDYTLVTDIEIVLTERVVATSSNADPLFNVTKNIINDLAILEADFTYMPMSTSTRWSSSDKITDVNVVSSSGIGNVTSGKFNHISKGITFAFTHWK